MLNLYLYLLLSLSLSVTSLPITCSVFGVCFVCVCVFLWVGDHFKRFTEREHEIAEGREIAESRK